MRARVKALVFAVAALLAARPALAQVGHVPATSPYLDLEYGQELTVLAGYVRTRHDPAGIAPKSYPLLGLRYEARLAGPLAGSIDVLAGSASRDVLDPLKPSASRRIGTATNAVVTGDAALAMNLTGERSWHSLVPQVRGGVGFVHGRAADDSSGFAFGTRFAFTMGGGMKYVPAGQRFQLRADVTDRIFKLDYPDAYYRLASDNTAVLPGSTSKSFYTHHTAFTVGVSYLFAR